MPNIEVYIGSGGSNVSPHESWATAANAVENGIDEFTGNEGAHTANLDDETHTIAVGNLRFQDYFPTAGSFAHVFTSRSEDPALCIVQTADDRLWRVDQAGATQSYTFTGITHAKSATITSGTIGGLFFQIQNDALDLLLDRNVIGPITVSNAVASAAPLLLINAQESGTVELRAGSCDSIVYSSQPDEGVFARVTTASELRLSQGQRINDLTITSNQTGASKGVIFGDGGTVFISDAVFDAISWDNTDASTGGSAVVCNPPINLEDTVSLTHTIQQLTMSNVDHSGGGARGFGIRTETDLVFGRLVFLNCVCDPEASGTTSGRGALFVHEVGSVGAEREAYATGTWLEVRDSQGDRGTALYAGGGGGAAIEVIVASGLTVEGGAVYNGGDRGVMINAFLITGCDYKNDGNDEDGLLLEVIINNPTDGTSTKDVTIRHMTGVGNADSTGANLDMCLLNGNEGIETITLTTLIENSILYNDTAASAELVFDETGATSTHNATVRNCYVRGGVTDSGVSSLTETGVISTGLPGVLTDGRLDGGSQLQAAGYNWWTAPYQPAPIGADGLRRHMAPCIGATELRRQSGYARRAGAFPATVLGGGVDYASVRLASATPKHEPHRVELGVDFNGTDAFIDAISAAGATSNKTLLLSFWFYRRTTAAGTIMNTTGSRIVVSFSAAGDLIVLGENAAGTTILNSGVVSNTINGWHHFALSVDMANASNRHAYLDGAVLAPGWTTYTDDTLDHDNSQVSVGGTVTGGTLFDGAIQEFYYTNEFLDLSVSSNLEKFIIERRPVDLGSDGSTPTGTAPLVYLNQPFGTFNQNSGSLGNGTLEGTFSAFDTAPSL